MKVFQYYFWYQSQYNKKLVFKKPFPTFFLLLKNDIRDFESFLKNCVQLQRTIEKLVSRLRGSPSPSLFQSFVPEFHFQCLTCMNNNYSIYSQYTLSLPLKISENRKVFWCFQGVEKGCIGNKWVNVIRTTSPCRNQLKLRIFWLVWKGCITLKMFAFIFYKITFLMSSEQRHHIESNKWIGTATHLTCF